MKLHRAGCGSNGADTFCAGVGTGGDMNQSAADAAATAAAGEGGVAATVAAETWPAFTRDHNPATMVFGYTDPPGQVHRNYRFDKCNFWDEQFAKLIPHQASSQGGEW